MRIGDEDCRGDRRRRAWPARATYVVAAAATVLCLPATARAQPSTGLPHHVPQFCQPAGVISVADGAWSDAAVWSTGRVPDVDDRVLVAAGTSVTYDVVSDAALECVRVEGRLAFRPDSPTRLTVATLLVVTAGILEIGTASSPVTAGAELVIADRAIDLSFDPEQIGTGLVVLGRLRMHGAPKTPTFTRVAQEPLAGATTLGLAVAPIGWTAGDELVIPDTRQRHGDTPQWEEPIVTRLAGPTVHLDAPLTYDHHGARRPDGTLEWLPHVGNLSRTVTIRSANPAGTRGHVMLIGPADVDVRYARFRNLGRTTNEPLDSTIFDDSGAVTHIGTNQIARYALHMHHLHGPTPAPASGHQFALVGNAVDGARKWGLVAHASHYGLISDNVIYDTVGAGLVGEDGTESHNVIERNFVVRTDGTRESPTSRHHDDSSEFGFEGGAFWFRGPNNVLRDNIAANAALSGFSMIAVDLGSVRIPAHPGASAANPDESIEVDMNALPLREFARNEVYGATRQGLDLWWLGAFGSGQPREVAETVIQGVTIWHVRNYALRTKVVNRLTVEDMVVRGDVEALRSYSFVPRGVHHGDYLTRELVIRRADLRGLRIGLRPPVRTEQRRSTTDGVVTVEDSYLRNYYDVLNETMFAFAASHDLPPRHVVIRNTTLHSLPITPFEGQPQVLLSMQHDLQLDHPTLSANVVQLDTLVLDDLDGIAGNDLQLYYPEQASGHVVPQTSGALVGAPVAGLTNQESWTRFGIAVAGAVAPCTSTRAGFIGFVCAPQPTPARPLAVTMISPSSGDPPGGRRVTLTGTGFVPGMQVTFGGLAGSSVEVIDATSMRVRSPSHPVGLAAVVATAPDGSQAAFPGAFRYRGEATSLGVSVLGPGRVLSQPAGIDCGTDCFETFTNPVTVHLVPIADPGAVFAGWLEPACRTGQIPVDGAVSCSARFSPAQPMPSHPTAIELNGDARPDVFTYDPLDGRWAMELGDGAGGFATIEAATGWSAGWTVHPARFDDDALTDALLYNPDTGHWFQASNTGGDFAYTGGRWSPGWEVHVLDLDGDDRSDVFLHDATTGAWFRCLTDGAGRFRFAPGNWSPGWEVYPARLDGDGLADLFLYQPGTGDWYRAVNDGTGFRYTGGRWSPGWHVTPGDFDGDGIDDVFLYAETSGEWYLCLSIADGFIYRQGHWSPGWTIDTGDLDADGDDDLFLHDGQTGVFVEVLIAGGTELTYRYGAWSPGWRVVLAHLDADARTDVLLYNDQTGHWYQALSRGSGAFSYGSGVWRPGLAIAARLAGPH